MINPYYHPEKLDLELISFDEPDMYWEYNTLCFWATREGLVYSASDAGCSCPTPFEEFDGDTQTEVTQKLERVGSLEQALQIFDSWNKDDYRNKTYVGIDERNKLSDWIKKNLAL